MLLNYQPKSNLACNFARLMFKRSFNSRNIFQFKFLRLLFKSGSVSSLFLKYLWIYPSFRSITKCHDKVVESRTDFVSSSRPINGIKIQLRECGATLGAFTTFPFGWFTSIKARVLHLSNLGMKNFQSRYSKGSFFIHFIFINFKSC